MTKDTIQRCSDLKNDATNKLASPKKLFETLLCFCVPRVTWLQERLVFDAWKSEPLCTAKVETSFLRVLRLLT